MMSEYTYVVNKDLEDEIETRSKHEAIKNFLKCENSSLYIYNTMHVFNFDEVIFYYENSGYDQDYCEIDNLIYRALMEYEEYVDSLYQYEEE
ncbi:hypothetical protein ACTXGU_00100 [Niallia sp. 01092]|uniref:hypothetical protein n=1 Tax=Niallia sp. 01092 TaxID=3457759 RepID=UPI003FD2A4BA